MKLIVRRVLEDSTSSGIQGDSICGYVPTTHHRQRVALVWGMMVRFFFLNVQVLR